MIEKIVNVIVKEDGFDNLNSKVDSLDNNLDSLNQQNKNLAGSFAESSNAVLENGGAMALLNDLTGGYAMMVKDAVEASALFVIKKKADTVATNATTVATVSANTATQTGIITKIKDVATTVSSTVAKYATAAATQVVTAAQWLWNAAVVANPLVALVVAIVAAGAAIYKLTSYLMENTKANEVASLATAKMTAQLKEQSIQAARGLRALKESADYNYELAKANGASTAELRKMKEASINAEIALNKKNVTIAQATFLQERNNLAVAKANGLSDDEIAKKEKLVQASYKEFQEQNNLLDTSYKERAKLIKSFNVEIANENKQAKDKANDEAQKQREKDKADALKKKQEAIQKAKDDAKNEVDRINMIKDIVKNYNRELEDIYDVTEQQKLDRQKERAFEEINLLKATEEEKRGILSLATEKFLEKQKELDEKLKKEKKEKEEKEIEDRLAYLEKFQEKETEFKDATSIKEIEKLEEQKQLNLEKKQEEDIAKAESLNASEAEMQSIKDYYIQKDLEIQNAAQEQKNAIRERDIAKGEQAISDIKSLFGKSKAVQKGAIIAESAIGIGKSIIALTTANTAALATPQAIASGGIAAIPTIAANTLSATANIASNLAATQKALQAVGGGSAGGAGGVPSGAGATSPPPPPPPQFNIVGQSSTNQLAQSIGAKQGQPIQAYVLSNEVTTQQAADRNRIKTATFN